MKTYLTVEHRHVIIYYYYHYYLYIHIFFFCKKSVLKKYVMMIINTVKTFSSTLYNEFSVSTYLSLSSYLRNKCKNKTSKDIQLYTISIVFFSSFYTYRFLIFFFICLHTIIFYQIDFRFSSDFRAVSSIFRGLRGGFKFWLMNKRV